MYSWRNLSLSHRTVPNNEAGNLRATRTPPPGEGRIRCTLTSLCLLPALKLPCLLACLPACQEPSHRPQCLTRTVYSVSCPIAQRQHTTELEFLCPARRCLLRVIGRRFGGLDLIASRLD